MTAAWLSTQPTNERRRLEGVNAHYSDARLSTRSRSLVYLMSAINSQHPEPIFPFAYYSSSVKMRVCVVIMLIGVVGKCWSLIVTLVISISAVASALEAPPTSRRARQVSSGFGTGTTAGSVGAGQGVGTTQGVGSTPVSTGPVASSPSTGIGSGIPAVATPLGNGGVSGGPIATDGSISGMCRRVKTDACFFTTGTIANQAQG